MAVLVVGAAVTAHLAAVERRSAVAADAEAVAQATELRAVDVADAVGGVARYLAALAAFPLQEDPGTAEFQAFATRLVLDDELTDQVSYVRLVLAEEIAELEAARRAAGQPTFQVRTTRPDGRYHVVLFSGPGDARIDGLDVGAFGAVADSFEQAARTGEAVVTEPFLDPRPDPAGEGVVSVGVLAPVYRAGMPTGTEEQRERALLAWAATTIPLERLVAAVQSGGIRLTVHDTKHPELQVTGPGGSVLADVPAATTTIDVLGRRWVVEGEPLATFDRAGHAATHVALASALASVAVAALVHAVARQRNRLTRQVREAVVRIETSDRRFRAVFDHAPIGVAVVDQDGVVVEENPTLRAMLGGNAGRHIRDRFLPADMAEVDRVLAQLRSGELDSVEAEVELRRGDGSTVWCRVTASPLPGDGAVVALIHDITAEREAAAAAEELRQRQARFEAMVQHSTDLISMLDKDGKVAYVSPAVRTVYGLEPSEIIGQDPLDVVHPDDREAVAQAKAKAYATPGVHRATRYRIVRPDGEVRVIEVTANNLLHDPDVACVVTNSRDVTTQAEAAEALRQRAFTDPLTGLATRDVLLEQLGLALARAREQGGTVALLFVDLDRFKQVNDRYGHAVGDALLVEVANSLKEAVRPGDMVARHGGDEFVILLESVRNEREARGVAERVRVALRRPFPLPGGSVVEPGASVGVVLSDGDTSPAAMLHDADSALYRAKQSGRDRIDVFDDDLRRRAERRVAAEAALRAALDEGGLSLRYEPVADLAAGEIVGAEARAWVPLPDGGVLAGAELLAVAQEAGLATVVGGRSLEEACRAVVAWSREGGKPRWVGLDVSAAEVTDPSFPERLARVLTATRVHSGALRLELPVDLVVGAAGLTRRAIAAARALGVHVVLDGVGAELRDLASLGSLAVDGLKVDLGSLPDPAADPVAAAVAGSVASVAAAAGLPAVVVGADRPEQVEAVHRLGFRYVQGNAVAPILDAGGLLTLGT